MLVPSSSSVQMYAPPPAPFECYQLQRAAAAFLNRLFNFQFAKPEPASPSVTNRLNKNIARIAKSCPENISSVVKVSSCFY